MILKGGFPAALPFVPISQLRADASAYGRAEKAPGTGLARVPVQLFEQLAAGGRIESVADFERTQAEARNTSRGRESNALKEPVAPTNPRAGAPNLRILLAVTALAALLVAAWVMRRRVR